MLKNALPKVALWIALSVVFAAGAVSLLVLAVASGSNDEPRPGGAGSTSWYTTRAPETSEPPQPSDPGQGGTPGPTEEPSGPTASTAPSELPTPVTVVTQTVIAVPADGGGDGLSSLIAALGSLLSGAAAVGTLLYAVHLNRQIRSTATTANDATSAASS